MRKVVPNGKLIRFLASLFNDRSAPIDEQQGTYEKLFHELFSNQSCWPSNVNRVVQLMRNGSRRLQDPFISCQCVTKSKLPLVAPGLLIFAFLLRFSASLTL